MDDRFQPVTKSQSRKHSGGVAGSLAVASSLAAPLPALILEVARAKVGYCAP